MSRRRRPSTSHRSIATPSNGWQACGVPSTILRCGLYCDFILEHWLEPSQASGELALPAGHGLVAPISRDDVAAAVAAVAAKPDKPRGIHTLTGHRALGFDEIAAAYGETIGRQLRYRACSADEYLGWATGRLDDPWPEAFSTLCASIAEGRYSHVSSDFTEIAGREPESFADFLARAASGVSGSHSWGVSSVTATARAFVDHA